MNTPTTITKKTSRVNNVNLTVDWPINEVWTIDSLWEKNTQFPAVITLRSRNTKRRESGEVAMIGLIHQSKGRPQSVYTLTPVTQGALEDAKSKNVVLDSSYSTVIVASIDNKTSSTSLITPEPTDTLNSQPKTAEYQIA